MCLFQYSPLIGGGNFDYVHHMLVYLCGGLNVTAVNDSAPCFGTAGATLSECLNGELIAGWAVGGVVSRPGRWHSYTMAARAQALAIS